jgi:phosphohistidine phosphatase
MRTLTLVRHAKAVAPDGRIEDHERELAPRGHEQARSIGRATTGSPPRLVLCSTALRTRQTLEDIAAFWRSQPEIRFERALYLAAPATILAQLESVGEDAAALWVIGHNPGIHDLALAIAAKSPGGNFFPDLQSGFPTAARAVFQSDAASWRDFARARNHLAEFARILKA